MKYSIIYFEEGMGWYDWTTADESARAHSEIIYFNTKNEAHDYRDEIRRQKGVLEEYQVIDKP